MEPHIITRAERTALKGCSSCGKAVPPSAAPQLPSNWQMLKNLVVAAGQAARNGFDVRNEEETEAALKICSECPRLIEQEGGARCGECGCWLGDANKLGKVSLRAWHCPLGKW